MRPHHLRPHRLLAAMAFLATIALAACSSSPAGTLPSATPPAATSAPAATASSAGGTGEVAIKDFVFGPSTITVAVGATVTWTNRDSASHTATADDGSFDSKALGNGSTFSQSFTKAGTYAYHCSIHSSMTGTVTVN